MALRMFLMEEALEEERLERRRNRRRVRDSFNINIVPDLEFVSNYRLSRALFEELCQDIVPLLPRKRNLRAVEPTTKILVALNFYARGSYQGSVGQNDDAPMAQQTVSRCIREVSLAINTPEILRKYIKFPQNTSERTVIKRKFYEKYNFPGVIGCIDCTHIAIVRPREHEERFFNRKHFHSINTQVICDSDCIILDVNATYGGATHDAFIWSQCAVKSHLESLTEQAYLLDPNDPRRVIVKKLALCVTGRDDVELDLSGDLTDLKKQVFVIKEGVQYRIRIDFIVQREIVHGLKYVQKTYRLGVPVDKMTHMVGSYPPKTEIQSYTTPPEDAPSGMVARGSYSVNSLFTDDDKNVHLQWEWCFDIKKDWKD